VVSVGAAFRTFRARSASWGERPDPTPGSLKLEKLPSATLPPFPSTPRDFASTLRTMKTLVLLLASCLAVTAGDRVKFVDDRYSLEFPQGWKKTQAPNASSEFARANKDETVMVAVSSQAIPAGAEVALGNTARDAAAKLAEAFKIEGEGTISEGVLDGCETRFVAMVPEKGELGAFAVFIDARRHLVTVQATMVLPMAEGDRDACLAILQSFRREDAKPAEKKPDSD